MTPPIGIGILSLTGILFIAYILFLVEQHKLQDELARHCREEEDERWHSKNGEIPRNLDLVSRGSEAESAHAR